MVMGPVVTTEASADYQEAHVEEHKGITISVNFDMGKRGYVVKAGKSILPGIYTSIPIAAQGGRIYVNKMSEGREANKVKAKKGK